MYKKEVGSSKKIMASNYDFTIENGIYSAILLSSKLYLSDPMKFHACAIYFSNMMPNSLVTLKLISQFPLNLNFDGKIVGEMGHLTFFKNNGLDLLL